MKNKRLFIILFSLLALLLIPFIVIQFTDEVNWSGFDFLVMGALLLMVGLTIEFILRKVTKINSRLALVVTVVILFLLVWAELAVGIF